MKSVAEPQIIVISLRTGSESTQSAFQRSMMHSNFYFTESHRGHLTSPHQAMFQLSPSLLVLSWIKLAPIWHIVTLRCKVAFRPTLLETYHPQYPHMIWLNQMRTLEQHKINDVWLSALCNVIGWCCVATESLKNWGSWVSKSHPPHEPFLRDFFFVAQGAWI